MENREQTGFLAPGVATIAILGGGALIIAEVIASSWLGAVVLIGLLALAVAVGLGVWTRPRAHLRRPALIVFVGAMVAVGAIGWWSSLRERTVDEEVAVAAGHATGADRVRALRGAGDDEPTPDRARPPERKPEGPVSLAEATLVGADGHNGSGKAEVISNGSDRVLALTDFAVDPGPEILVLLTPDPDDNADRINLGVLKGTNGNQQYEIPASVNLGRYDTVVLYCQPFSVRIAVAELR